jgi:DNA-binding CsgD family transcriptional regulator
MPLPLTSADLARLEAASRALLSPLATPDPAAWMREAGEAVRALVGLDALVLLLPDGTSYFSDDAPEVVAGADAYTEAHLATGTLFSDPVVRLWHELRKSGGHDAFSFTLNAQMVGKRGYGIEASPLVSDILMGNGYRDFAGLITTTAAGDAMIWALGRGRPAGDDPVALLRLLVPSFHAGLDALARLGAHCAALDAVAEPAVLFDADGRERHRNAALVRLLAAEPDPERVLVEVRALAASLGSLAAPRWGQAPAGPAAPAREVRTARGAYRLRGAVLPEGAFASAGSLLVSVDPAGVASLPSPEAVRDRLGLSAREAEVALLLAEGLSNADVAGRLFIAPATARRHTENVLGKLGLSKRSAVAASLLAAA